MKQSIQRWWDWPAIVLLFAAFWTASLRLEITDWTKDLNRVITLTLIGVIFGFLLGKSRFSSRFVFFYSLIITLIVIPWQLGLMMDEKILWLERLGSIGGRLWTTYSQFSNNIPVEDSLLFLAAMMAVYWISAITAGFHLVRESRPWFGLAVVSIAVFVIEFYDPPRATRGLYTSFYAILVILLISRLYYINLRKRWETNNIPVDTETSFDWMRAALVAGFVLVFLAWNIPYWIRAISPNTPERRELSQSLQAVREKLSNVVAPLTGSVPSEGDYYQNDINLGTSISTSDEVVFVVTASDQRPGGSRYYWRARSYDHYQNGQWVSSFNDREDVSPVEEVLPIPAWKGRFESTFTFALQTPIIRNFFSPGMPLTISRPAQAVGENVSATYLDTSTLLAVPPLHAGEFYRIKASISAPTKNDLEASQINYPDWINQYYLQLPPNFPEKIRNLADEITAGLDNPFDKTEAITNYLRQNITYKTVLQSGPSNMDPMEYMLFVSKEGFCYYYASAEIIMLRSIGIPARLAVGFAEGEVDDRRTTYTILRRDAHAWPEVYFNDFGWVEFEPTVIQTALVRREVSPNAVAQGSLAEGPLQSIDEGNLQDLRGEQRAEDLLNAEATPPDTLPANRSYILWLAIFLLLLPLGLGLFLWQRMQTGKLTIPPLAIVIENNLIQRGFTTPTWIHERARLAKLTPLERAFSSVPKALKLLGKPASHSLTPTEQVNQLLETLPEAASPAQILLEELHRGIYSYGSGDLELAQKTGRIITRQAWRFWLKRLLKREFINENLSGF
ncbi:MAG TPA: transglutaminaseTgpA domain-containing protein [Longilinea sp.]|nr:transglutaminaseTgpA domain-containing protein [Longilinea sp.]